MPKNSQYKFVFLSVQIKGLSRVMFDGRFIHLYANYSQRNHFGVFLVMQFDREYKTVMESSSGPSVSSECFIHQNGWGK